MTTQTSFKHLLKSSYGRPVGEHESIFGSTDDELERQLIHHWVMSQGFGGNVITQLDDILNVPNARVLDIGCAGGVWVMEMAAAFPQATFVGIDNNSCTLPNCTIPSNAEFEIGDVVKEKLPFQNESFDFVFVRDMKSVFDKTEWQQLLKEIWRVLKPTGLCEISDIEENSFPPTAPYLSQWGQNLEKALSDRNVDFTFVDTLANQISSYGQWATVYSRTVQIPLGLHGGELGRLMVQDLADMIEPTLRFGGVIDELEIQEHAENIFREIDEHEFYIPFTAVVVRKNFLDMNET